MSIARIRFIQKMLKEKYGEIGVVAGRYVEAGYSVRVMHPTRYGPAHIIASGNKQRLVIEVFKEHTPVPPEVVKNLVEKAKLLNGKPILVLYGDGPKLTDEVYKLCKELGVKIRRIRGQ